MKKIIFLQIFILFFPHFAEARMADKIIAKVGSDIITLSDKVTYLKKKEHELQALHGAQEGNQVFTKIKENVLEELILDKILMTEIEKEQITISQDALELEFDAILRNSGLTEKEFIIKLGNSGMSLAEYKETLKNNLARNQFMQKKIMPHISVSDDDLRVEYQKNLSRFQSYNKLQFIEVFLQKEKFKTLDELEEMAQTIHSRLQTGQSATELIKQYSSGAFANKGGNSGMISAKDLRPEFRSLLSTLKVNQTSRMIPVTEGVFIFKLLHKADPEPIPFNEVVNAVRSLYVEKVIGDELQKYLLSIKEQMYVEIIDENKT